MESLGAKLAVAGGSTAAVGGAGAGIYLTQGAEASAVETINEQSNINEDKPKNHTPKDNLEKPQLSSLKKEENLIPPKNRTVKPNSAQGSVDEDAALSRYWLYLLDADNSENEYWWKQKYDSLKTETKENLDTKFQDLSNWYSDKEEKSLNKVCASLYQQKDSNFTSHNPVQYNNNPRNNFKLVTSNLTNNFWKYCSLLDNRPQNLNEAGESEKSNGDIIKHQSYYADYLIATETTVNNKFWELKNEWFKALSDPNEIKTKQKLIDYAKTQNNNQDFSSKSIKEICKSLHKTNHITNNKNVALILSYCSYFDYPFYKWFNLQNLD